MEKHQKPTVRVFSRRNPNPCPHVDQIQPVVSDPQGYALAYDQGCSECLEQGDTWVHLRMCMTCGNVGCCDESKNKHATRHHHATSHPIIRSLEPDENWMWCYPDNLLLVPG